MSIEEQKTSFSNGPGTLQGLTQGRVPGRGWQGASGFEPLRLFESWQGLPKLPTPTEGRLKLEL